MANPWEMDWSQQQPSAPTNVNPWEKDWSNNSAPANNASNIKDRLMSALSTTGLGAIPNGISAIKNYFANNKGKDTSLLDEVFTGGTNLVNSATLNHEPQIMAGIDKALDYISPSPNEATYVQRRDSWKNQLDSDTANNPKSADLGKLLGIGATIGATPEMKFLDAIPAGSGYVGKVLSGAAKTAIPGAAYGALQNPGDKEGEVDPLQLKERLTNALKGGALGGAIGGGISAAAELPQLASQLREGSYSKAVDALRPYKKDYKALVQNPDMRRNIGKQVMESSAMSGLPKNADELAQILGEERQAAGVDFGNQLKGLDGLLKRKAQASAEYVARPAEAAEMVDGVKVGNIHLDPNTGNFPATGDEPIRVNFTTPDEVVEKVAPEVGVDLRTVGQNVKNNLIEDSVLPQMKRANSKVEGTVNRLLNNSAENPVLSVEEAQALKQQADKFANWNHNPQFQGPLTTEAAIHRQISTSLRQGIEQAGDAALDHLDPEKSKAIIDAFKATKQRYGGLSKAEDIARGRALGDATNRAVSPSDYAAGAMGLLSKTASGGVGAAATGVAAGAANKAFRLYGNQVLARGLRSGANLADILAAITQPVANGAQQLNQTYRTLAPASAWNYMGSGK